MCVHAPYLTPLDPTATQWIVVEASALHPLNRLQQFIVVSLVVNRIDRSSIDNEERRSLEFMEEARIRLVQPFQVLPLDVLFVVDAAFGNALQQYVHRRLQVDYEIGFG